MNKTEAITFMRAFMEATGLTNDDIVKPAEPKKPTIDDLCPRKRWVPKNGDYFYSVTSCGGVYRIRWSNSPTDQKCLAFGSVFPTEEAAHEHLANMKAWVELRERSCVYRDHFRFPVMDTSDWRLPGVRFESEEARDLAVEAVGGQGRIDKLVKWLHNK